MSNVSIVQRILKCKNVTIVGIFFKPKKHLKITVFDYQMIITKSIKQALVLKIV